MKIIIFQLKDENTELKARVEELQKLNFDLQRSFSKHKSPYELREIETDYIVKKRLKKSIKARECEEDKVCILSFMSLIFV